jgi:DNA polymerase V
MKPKQTLLKTRKKAGRPFGTGKFGKKTRPIRVPEHLADSVLDYVDEGGFEVPLFTGKVPAGFPIHLEDNIDSLVEAGRIIISNPKSSFLVYASGQSMIGYGIDDGDLLVVDRSIEPTTGKIVIAAIDGEFTVKKLKISESKQGKKIELVPGNPAYKTLDITGHLHFYISGIVVKIIKEV